MEKVEGRREPTAAWRGRAASKLAIEEEGTFVCKGVRSIQGGR